MPPTKPVRSEQRFCELTEAAEPISRQCGSSAAEDAELARAAVLFTSALWREHMGADAAVAAKIDALADIAAARAIDDFRGK